MSNYKVIGYEHKEGISKKNNKPYSLDIIHCIIEQRLDETGNGYGNRVESIVYNAFINGPLEAVPGIGDYIDIHYSRTGYVTDIVPVKG